MRKRFEKAFDKVLLNDKEKNQIIENVISHKSVAKEKDSFWQGKTGGVIVVACALLVFVLINAVIFGGMRKGTPVSAVLDETGTVETLAAENESTDMTAAETVAAADETPEAIEGAEDVNETLEAIEGEEDVNETPELDGSDELSQEQQAEIFQRLADYMPVKNAVMTSGFGLHRDFPHTGIDLTADETAVYLVMDGTVTAYDFTAEKGNYLVIDHGNGIVTEYHHLKESMVSVGDVLSAGASIAIYGNTGMSTGAHLHWEIIVNGEYQNPLVYVSDNLKDFLINPWN